jgi:hypothetical protein
VNFCAKKVEDVFQVIQINIFPIYEAFINTILKKETWKCDGFHDCGLLDDSDEYDCKNTTCDDLVREFVCEKSGKSDKCLPITQKCDGHDDCGDGSDEMNCNCTCKRAFSCKSKCECIDPKRVCDSVIDCSDGSDETSCPCARNEYSCSGGRCINSTKLCDGTRDCENGDDETHPNCCNFTLTIICFLKTIKNINNLLSAYNDTHDRYAHLNFAIFIYFTIFQ